MFDRKKTTLKLLSITLFTTISFHDARQVLARLTKTPKKQNYFSYIAVANNTERSEIENNTDDSHKFSGLKLSQNKKKDNELLYESIGLEDLQLQLVSNNIEHRSILISKKAEGYNNSAENSKSPENRAFISYFLLLLFTPFGIFYPFFLFYKKLLNTDKNKNEISSDSAVLTKTSELKPLSSFSPDSLKQEKSADKIKAVVSKLQIAFAVKDDNLRQQLMELCSSVDSRTDLGIAELMRKTVSLLINQAELTHVCNSSESLTIDRVKAKFEAICVREENKFTSEKLGVVGEDSENVKSTDSAVSDLASYIVVTLVLCTSHSEPLFGDIHTKNQLLEKLSELGKIRQDDLIKFDLLWNPRSQEQYLSNNDLLKNYIDMVRLF